ncbi:Uncharacterized conserved protein YacL, contains PIN and TRAM domains [Ligilactobacillus sp. WC1T17]|uniref:Uncharacterized conserved protein YacL, contains PIN and TRAM domains n=1 Tax=Ligilactobacillus ruminis TaxID=1623 RepID=A0ABY1AD16_9LACO|nr:Uncharacterized conserved protein YacL, contains PIN and TRAM domains [Ligilactobacillus ruminis]
MRKRMIQLVFVILGISMGYSFLPDLWFQLRITNHILRIPVVNALIGLVVMGILALFLVGPVEKLLNKLEKNLAKQQTEVIIAESIAIVVSLLIAVLISTLFWRSQLFFINTVLPIITMILFAYMGWFFGRTRLNDLMKLFGGRLNSGNRKKETEAVLERKAGDNFHKYKLLDTNILIDGRIYDLAKTGFLEGTLIVPNFVLYELQYIADSGDSIKRVRGRRGLDILNKLRSEKIVPVEMYEGDFEDIPEVDSKLIKLAKLLDAVIVTNDYNLNKVSEFQNVQVLNVNALAKSLKPRVIPGEKLNVMVIKNGTERQQGVAYLDDGTMIVVEDGRYFMNKTIEVEVTSALQTDAGRMIFAKPVHSKRGIKEKN